MTTSETNKRKFQVKSITPLEDSTISVSFEYVDRTGTSWSFHESIQDHQDAEPHNPPERLAALQLLQRVQEMHTDLEMYSDQFLALRYPR